MTARHGDWHLLGLSSDPVPADRYDVLETSRTYARRATELEDASRLLGDLARADGWTGRTAERFRERASETVGDVRKAATKYAGVDDALRAWADEVDRARTRTAAALHDADDAEGERRRNDYDSLSGIAEPTTADLAHQDLLDRRVREAEANLRASRRHAEEALDDLDHAARHAAGRIQASSEIMKDSRIDDVRGSVELAFRALLARLQQAMEVVAWALAALVDALADAIDALARGMYDLAAKALTAAAGVLAAVGETLAELFWVGLAMGAMAAAMLEAISRGQWRRAVELAGLVGSRSTAPITGSDGLLLARAAYGDDDPPVGWSEVKPQNMEPPIDPALLRDDTSGFQATIYVFGTPPTQQYVVSFRGSGDAGDWRDNATGGSGLMVSPQARRAVALALAVNARHGGHVTFTGHSLGGRLASLGSIATGAPAITANGAGVSQVEIHFAEIEGGRHGTGPGQVTNFRGIGDPLTTVQNGTIAGDSVGDDVYVDIGLDPNPKDLHNDIEGLSSGVS